MDVHELLMTALRGVGVYALMLVVIRLLGKRTIGNFTAFDLLVALMLGEVVDEIIYGDIDFSQGVVAIVVVAGAKYMTSWLSYRSHLLNRILEGSPTALVRDGSMVKEGMKAELMNDREVFASLRLKGIEDLREVRLATLEVDGEVSVLKQEWAETVQKSDLHRIKDKEAESDPGPTPEDKRTDSPYALGRSA